MTIIIDCEWDEGELRATEIKADGWDIPYTGERGVKIHRLADDLSKAVGNWKIMEDARNVSP